MRSKQSCYQELRDYLLNGGNTAEIEAYDLRFLKLHILDYVQECRRAHKMEIADRCVQLFEQIRQELSDRQSANAVKVRAPTDRACRLQSGLGRSRRQTQAGTQGAVDWIQRFLDE
jgi:hypothetical protein